MSFDALSLSAVRDELRGAIQGGRVQRIVGLGPLEVGLELYASHRRALLLCSAAGENGRVCLVRDWPARAVEGPTPFLLLLRKHVRDGRIVGVEQPTYERVLSLRVSKRDERGILRETFLIIETMGRRSNALLVDDQGVILEALKKSGPARNPRRPVLPRRPYLPPPPQARLDPLADESWERLRELAGGPRAGDPLEAVLGANLAGFSPLAAREAAHRATGNAEMAAGEVRDWDAVRAAVASLLAPLESGDWEPTVALEVGRVVAFAPYRMTHLEGLELQGLESISEAVEQWAAVPAGPKLPGGARELAAEIERLAEQQRRRRQALERELTSAEAAEGLRLDAETILASLGTIGPGQTRVELDGREVALDSSLAPLDQAQALFGAYRKARDAGRRVPEMLEAARHELRYLEELRVLAEVAGGPADLRAIREELAQRSEQKTGEAAGGKRGRPKPAVPRVRRLRSPEGWEVLVGTSARGNAEATFKLAGPDDLWLHARGVPGSHVIVRTSGREAPPATVEYAARLAAGQSQARTAGRVEVDVTARRYVRRVPGGPVGLATYREERTVAVAPLALPRETR